MSGTHFQVVFLTRQPYPHGLAGTKILQNLIDALRPFDDVRSGVLVLRGRHAGLCSSRASGTYRGTPYCVVGAGDRGGFGAVRRLGRWTRQAEQWLGERYNASAVNVLFVYGGPDLLNLRILRGARRSGYKVAFYVVEDVHAMPAAHGLGSRVDRWGERLLVRRVRGLADGVFVISAHLQAKFERLCNGRCPVTLLPVSVNPADYPPEPTPFHNPVRIHYGGAFAEKDGVETLIEAFDRIAETYPNTELVLSGRGPDYRMAAIRSRVDAARHRGRVRFTGYIPPDDYYRFLADCDILCAVRTGSAFAATGFPFKLGEYLATGKPVIATAVGDVGGYLRDRVDAVLVPPDSVRALADALAFLLGDRDRAERIGRAGRQTAWNYFAIEKLGPIVRKGLYAVR